MSLQIPTNVTFLIHPLVFLLFISGNGSFGVESEFHENTSAHHKVTVRERAPWSILQCSFLKRRPHLRFLHNQWGLDASGAYLLRKHPAVQKLKDSVKKPILGIVDTGLKVRGNSAAGKLLEECPCHDCYGPHGTHVAGITVSSKCGVNPHLPIKMFAVESDLRGAYNVANRSYHSRIDSFEKQIRLATQDPDIHIINLSWGLSQLSRGASAAVEDALEAGKWVVWASGNDSKVNSFLSALLPRLNRAYKNNFTVGALSYYAAPSDFSNFGPAVQYFAPGSAINSLFSGYNPNFLNSKETVSLNGTSMAAPHFAAVLATLKSMSPELTVKTARNILDRTSIIRGTKDKIRQVNPYLAVELLDRAIDLARNKGGTVSKHLDTAEEDIREFVSDLPILARPRTKSCKDWESYLNELKRRYFLTRGLKYSKQILASFSNKHVAENIYFSESGANPSKLPRVSESRFDREAAPAKEFYAGKRKVIDSTDIRNVKSTANILRLLPARQKYVDVYLRLCDDYLRGKDVESDLFYYCKEYLDDAPQEYRLALGKKLNDLNYLATPYLVNWLFDADTLLGVTTESSVQAKELVSDITRNWKTHKNRTILQQILPLLSHATVEDRLSLYRTYSQGKHVDEKLRLELLSWLPPKMVKGHANEIKKSFRKDSEDPVIGDFNYAVRRLAAGFGSEQTVKEAIDRLFGRAKESKKQWLADSDGGRHVPFLRWLIKNKPSLVLHFSTKLKETEQFLALFKFFTIGGVAKFVQKLDEPLASQVVDAGVKAAMLKYPRFFKDVESLQDGLYREPDLLRFLEKTKTHAKAARKHLENLQKQEQSDPVLQSTRISHLSRLALSKKLDTDSAIRLLLESPRPKRDIIDIDPKVLLKHPDGIEHVRRLLHRKGSLAGDSNLLLWLAWADRESFLRLLPTITDNIDTIFRKMQLDGGISLEQLAESIGYHRGSDKRTIEKIFRKVEPLLEDAAFLSAQATSREYSDKRYIYLTRFIQVLAHSKSGNEYLRMRPHVLEKTASLLAKDSHSSSLESGLSQFHELPEIFLDSLRKQLPSISKKEAISRGPAPWMIALAGKDPGSLGYFLEYMKKARFSNVWISDLEDALLRLAFKHPEVRPIMISSTLSEDFRKEIRGLP